MTGRIDNQTPQLVDDEIHAITKELFLAGVRQGYQEATYGKSDPAGPEAQKAKARLLRWGTRQRMNEVGSVMMEYSSHGKTYPVTTDINGKIQSVEDRYRELQASLKDGENQLGEKS